MSSLSRWTLLTLVFAVAVLARSTQAWADARLLRQDRVQSLVGHASSVHGPNCWNAALYATGFVRGLRHTLASEYTRILSTSCEEVSEELSTTGDLVAFRRVDTKGKLVNGPYGYELHGFALIERGHAFTKNGAYQRNEYRLQDVESLVSEYQVTNRRECRQLGFPPELCHLKVQYFRCHREDVPALPEVGTETTQAVREFERDLVRLEKDFDAVTRQVMTTEELSQASVRLKEQVSRLRASLDRLDQSADGDTLASYLLPLEQRLNGVSVILF